MMQVEVDYSDEPEKDTGEEPEKSQNRERNGPGKMTGHEP